MDKKLQAIVRLAQEKNITLEQAEKELDDMCEQHKSNKNSRR